MLKILFMILLAINLFACTSAQEKRNIVENNWQELGEYHGKNGMIEHSLPSLQSLRDKYGNGEVDYPTYQQSYEKALIIYCQPNNAFKLGGSGKTYYGVCDRFPHGNQFRRDWKMIEDFGPSARKLN